ncbi:MAG: enoyl-CoA hydratase-related protein [Antricoccus sp.]
MSTELVLTEQVGRVMIITINRPAKRNAIDRATADALDDAFNTLEDDQGFWAGILAGGPVAFCAGSDLSAEGDYYTERGGEYGIIRRKRTKPLIAAVEGLALGGGMEIAMACDLIIAGEKAVFGLPEVKRGLVPACAGLFRGPRALPLNIASELIIVGDSISAARAAHFGFVNQVVREGDALSVAADLAERICLNGPVAVSLSLQAIHSYVAADDPSAWEITKHARDAVYASEDRVEGVSAFFDKRLPTWRNC